MTYHKLLLEIKELVKDIPDEFITIKVDEYMRKLVDIIEKHTNLDLYNQFQDLYD